MPTTGPVTLSGCCGSCGAWLACISCVIPDPFLALAEARPLGRYVDDDVGEDSV